MPVPATVRPGMLARNIVPEHRRRIGKHRAAKAEAFRNDRQRELRLGAGVQVALAAELLAGNRVDGTDAVDTRSRG